MVIIVVIVIGVFGFFIFWGVGKEYGFVCPSDLETRESYLDSVTKWVAEYQKDYPNATTDELMKVRNALIEKHGCGSAPPEEAQANDQIDSQKLLDGIKYAESQREDAAADALIKTTNEKDLYDNPYIKHIRLAFNGYLSGTNDGVEEGTAETSELDSGYRCGLDSFDKDYYKSEFTVVKVEKNDYGGMVAYITFLNNPDTLFWAWVYQYGGGEYVLRGFCENAVLIEQ